MNHFRYLFLLLLAFLGACDTVVMNPAGDIAAQERDLVLASTFLMLLIIVPVLFLILWFAWKYRHSNKDAIYEPDWDHSTRLELVIWSMPLLIVVCLGAITWVWTHLLDPYRPLSRVAQDQPVDASVKPLEIDVVALDWKWLFIYPEYKIATVNDVAAPVGRPILFRITASSVMNSFYIPALAGQIYAMPGMETPMRAVINKPGDYKGFSANYSGAGFSGMHFIFHGVDAAAFTQWIASAQKTDTLDRAAYLELAKPNANVPPHLYALKDDALYDDVLMGCVEPGKPCMDHDKATPTGMIIESKPVPETNDIPSQKQKETPAEKTTDAPKDVMPGMPAMSGMHHTHHP